MHSNKEIPYRILLAFRREELSRKKCVEIFKRYKLNISISKFIKIRKEIFDKYSKETWVGGMEIKYSDLDNFNEELSREMILLQREWNIKKIID